MAFLFLFICALCVILLGIICIAAVRIEKLQREEDTRDHAKCIGAVAGFVGDEFAARVLQSAADDYGTVEGQARLEYLRWNQWSTDGPAIPRLWLMDRAEALRGKEHV